MSRSKALGPGEQIYQAMAAAREDLRIQGHNNLWSRIQAELFHIIRGYGKEADEELVRQVKEFLAKDRKPGSGKHEDSSK